MSGFTQADSDFHAGRKTVMNAIFAERDAALITMPPPPEPSPYGGDLDVGRQIVVEREIGITHDAMMRGEELMRQGPPPENYQPLSDAAKGRIVQVMNRFSAANGAQRSDLFHYFLPATGEHINLAEDVDAVHLAQIIKIPEGWGRLDLEGVTWSEGRPVKYRGQPSNGIVWTVGD